MAKRIEFSDGFMDFFTFRLESEEDVSRSFGYCKNIASYDFIDTRRVLNP
ncbi:hypothetical protein JW707_02965 [Candidatus Woesearchaeota archaeon]|nr:hypothetical protein [Candidatus Woesearchaeota archaeon]